MPPGCARGARGCGGYAFTFPPSLTHRRLERSRSTSHHARSRPTRDEPFGLPLPQTVQVEHGLGAEFAPFQLQQLPRLDAGTLKQHRFFAAAGSGRRFSGLSGVIVGWWRWRATWPELAGFAGDGGAARSGSANHISRGLLEQCALLGGKRFARSRWCAVLAHGRQKMKVKRHDPVSAPVGSQADNRGRSARGTLRPQPEGELTSAGSSSDIRPRCRLWLRQWHGSTRSPHRSSDPRPASPWGHAPGRWCGHPGCRSRPA